MKTWSIYENLTILAAKGKDKESRKQLKQGFEKNISFICFCQSSSKHGVQKWVTTLIKTHKHIFEALYDLIDAIHLFY